MKCRTFVTLVWRRDVSPRGVSEFQRGGRSVANASVTSSRCDAKRKTAAGPPAGAARCAEAALDAFEHAAAEQHTLQVRRRDVVSERRDVHLAQLRDRERRRCEREADVRVGELRPQARLRGRDDRGVVARRAAAAGSLRATSPPRSPSERTSPRYAVASVPSARTRVSSCSRCARAPVSTARARAVSSDSPRASAADGSAPPSSSTSSRPSRARRTTPTTVCQVESATVFVPQSKTSESAVKKSLAAVLVLVLAVAAAGCGSSKKATSTTTATTTTDQRRRSRSA